MDDKKIAAMAEAYMINEPAFKILWFIWQQEGRIALWRNINAAKLVTQAGKHLRSLRDKGYLTGPSRRQPVDAKAWEPTLKTRNIMDRVQRGLLPIAWLETPYINNILQTLANGQPVDSLMIYKAARLGQLLAKAGYIERVPKDRLVGAYVSDDFNSELWQLTPTGRMAWDEFTNWKDAKRRESISIK